MNMLEDRFDWRWPILLLFGQCWFLKKIFKILIICKEDCLFSKEVQLQSNCYWILTMHMKAKYLSACFQSQNIARIQILLYLIHFFVQWLELKQHLIAISLVGPRIIVARSWPLQTYLQRNFEEILHNMVVDLHINTNIKFCHQIDFVQHYLVFVQLNTFDHGFAIVVRCNYLHQICILSKFPSILFVALSSTMYGTFGN